MIAMFTGGAAAILMMLATVEARTDLDSMAHLEWTALKVLFAVSVIGTAAPLQLRSMRPGLEKETRLTLIFLPFSVAIAPALVMFLFCHRAGVERDASRSHISVPGALPSLHRILCDNSIRNLGMGDSAGRTHAVKPQRSDRRSGRGGSWRRGLRA
jgi:hypothetical protein